MLQDQSCHEGLIATMFGSEAGESSLIKMYDFALTPDILSSAPLNKRTASA